MHQNTVIVMHTGILADTTLNDGEYSRVLVHAYVLEPQGPTILTFEPVLTIGKAACNAA